MSADESALPLGFFGDDFIGSVDALERLTSAGVKSVLFVRPFDTDDLVRFGDCQAFGIAGRTRTLPPAEIEGPLRVAFESFRSAGVALVHYKTGPTLETSPVADNIGRVIELGIEVFGGGPTPVVVGDPARAGGNTVVDSGDLLRGIARRTALPIFPLDADQIDSKSLADGEVGLMLCQTSDHVANVGRLLQSSGTKFVVGSAAVEDGLVSVLKRENETAASAFTAPGEAGPIVVVCGACSPSASEQIRLAIASGYADVVLRPNALGAGEINAALAGAVAGVTRALDLGRNVVLHTHADHRVDPAEVDTAKLGSTLGHVLRLSVQRRAVRRVLILGSETAGRVAVSMGVEALEMIAPLTRGAPLCRVTSANKAVNGIEVAFVCGPIEPDGFFERVRLGVI